MPGVRIYASYSAKRGRHTCSWNSTDLFKDVKRKFVAHKLILTLRGFPSQQKLGDVLPRMQAKLLLHVSSLTYLAEIPNIFHIDPATIQLADLLPPITVFHREIRHLSS